MLFEYLILVSFSEVPFIFFVDRTFFYDKFFAEKFEIERIFFQRKKENLNGISTIRSEHYTMFFFSNDDLCEKMPECLDNFLKSNNITVKNITEAVIDVGPGGLTSNRIMACFFYPILKLNHTKIKIIDHFSFYFDQKFLGEQFKEMFKIKMFYDTKRQQIFQEITESSLVIMDKIGNLSDRILIIVPGRKDSFFCKIFSNQEETSVLFNATGDQLNKIIQELNKANDYIFCKEDLKNKLDLIVQSRNLLDRINYLNYNFVNMLENLSSIEEEGEDFKLDIIYLTSAVETKK